MDEEGNPTFPILHQRDEDGRTASVPHGDLPSMHSFRHTVASRALLAGDSVDEIAFLLGHRDANVTRAVYVVSLPMFGGERCDARGCWPSSASRSSRRSGFRRWMQPSVCDLVHRRLTYVCAGMSKPKCQVGQA